MDVKKRLPGVTSIESCYCPGYNILTKLGQQRLCGNILNQNGTLS
ncbi:hypothetical protein GXM_00433 [Nostoc sphaeroides CCNUC1]|uniref:Uncharacterized protein n=1 Tax=Nostoc sphaeroides CCNUC1 TaxID=2653204 RepID=A0A5P8VRI8_9NOSO|nr:hypothetical protein GXM_00433 [Nostoc sphaeroides CCNUC1]